MFRFQIFGVGRGWSNARHGIRATDSKNCGTRYDAKDWRSANSHVQRNLPEGNTGRVEYSWFFKKLQVEFQMTYNADEDKTTLLLRAVTLVFKCDKVLKLYQVVTTILAMVFVTHMSIKTNKITLLLGAVTLVVSAWKLRLRPVVTTILTMVSCIDDQHSSVLFSSTRNISSVFSFVCNAYGAAVAT